MTIIIILFIIAFSLTVRNLLSLIFSIEKGSKQRARLRQLKFKGNANETTEEKALSLMERATNPIVKYVLPHVRINNIEEIATKLKVSRWDRYMTPMQFISISIMTKILGLIFFITQMNEGVIVPLIISVVFSFAIDFLLNNEINEKKKKLLLEFPDFIRMVQVYLSGGMTFLDALTETMEFMGDEWQEIIRNMIIIAGRGEVDECLDVLIDDFPIRESKEFVSLIKLNFTQGGDLSVAFESQAEKVRELYIDAKDAQIEKRKIYSTVMQFPLLVAAMLTFALPLVGSLMNFTGM